VAVKDLACPRLAVFTAWLCGIAMPMPYTKFPGRPLDLERNSSSQTWRPLSGMGRIPAEQEEGASPRRRGDLGPCAQHPSDVPPRPGHEPVTSQRSPGYIGTAGNDPASSALRHSDDSQGPGVVRICVHGTDSLRDRERVG
jgi:hypothetical protein